MSDAWDKVLSVRRLVWQTVNRWAPDHYNEDDKADLVHDAFLHLHHYADRHDPALGPWPVYAKVGTKMAVLDHFKAKRHPVQQLGDYDPVSTGLPGAERCRHCKRALRTKQQMAAGADRSLETRKHSAGICQACAKREKRRAR